MARAFACAACGILFLAVTLRLSGDLVPEYSPGLYDADDETSMLQQRADVRLKQDLVTGATQKNWMDDPFGDTAKQVIKTAKVVAQVARAVGVTDDVIVAVTGHDGTANKAVENVAGLVGSIARIVEKFAGEAKVVERWFSGEAKVFPTDDLEVSCKQVAVKDLKGSWFGDVEQVARVCHPSQKYGVDKKYPLIVLAHGDVRGGLLFSPSYALLQQQLAGCLRQRRLKHASAACPLLAAGQLEQRLFSEEQADRHHIRHRERRKKRHLERDAL